MRALIVALAVLVLMPAVTFSQPERYELGQRLKSFEKAWDQQTDQAARKRALAILPKVTDKFFSFQLGEAGRVLDQARWALKSDKPMPDDVVWAWSLTCEPEHFLTVSDGDSGHIRVKCRQFYKTDCAAPAKSWMTSMIGKLPKEIGPLGKFPDISLSSYAQFAKSGDATFKAELIVGETQEVRSWTQSFVLDDDWHIFDNGKRECLKSIEAKWKVETLESATLRHRLATFPEYRRTNPETTLAVASLIEEMKSMLAVGSEKPFFTHTRPGDFWMAFPTGKDQRTPARLFVPEKLDPKKQVPLIVALHGMGGSENLFFEGYGDGQIVKLCKERGWLLVAPRCPLFGPPPVETIVKQLGERYPVDPNRVYLVGHSMGAAQSVDLVQQHPKLFAGIALLGGGGRVKDAKPFAELPTFVGIGTKDQIAFRTAKDLNKTLSEGKAAKLTYKEYEDLEHLVIVREALPDAFKMFDQVK
jgi:predicted esterase